ncbi:cellulase family glycosylhydrolase [Echinicola pacifica]|nr:cellulase family glycosylhydrolase [Echinicola pacifica]
MRNLSLFAFILSFLLGASACDSTSSMEDPLVRSIQVDGDRFVDHAGREIILSGINLVNKSPKDNYMPLVDKDFYKRLQEWGMNSIRLVVIWDGVEPEMDQFDEKYLKELDKHIKWAAEYGVFVILDMHQDLFSAKYSDGAPRWATLDEGLEHYKGEVWSDSYLISPAVQGAFDNFWQNKPAADGKGLQDHYAEMWKMLAERYKNQSNVIGYDLMNEPFPGSIAQQAMPALLTAYGELHAKKTGIILGEEELMGIWSEPSSRNEALQKLDNAADFGSVIQALSPLTSAFEKERLQPFYQKVAQAIREVDEQKIIFLEHTYFGNMGVASSIQRTTLPNGKPDPQVAYAPHAYDLVVDTEFSSETSSSRVDYILQVISETAKKLQMPVWLGEWGAYYGGGNNMVPVAQHAITQIEKYNFSHAYWSYENGLENRPYFLQSLQRPYPFAINGELKNYHWKPDTNEFEMTWQENPSLKASTLIFFPDLSGLSEEELKVVNGKLITHENSNSGWVEIPANGKLRKITWQLD